MTIGSEAYQDRCSDEGLVGAVVSGCTVAFGAIFRRHGASVHKLAHRMVGDRAVADDVTQDVFLWFLDSAHRFDTARGSLAAYLLVRCRSRSLDVVRSEARRRLREQTLSVAPSRTWSESSEVERAAIETDDEREVLRLLGLLPIDEREALRLAFFGEFSYRDVASELSIPEGTAKSRIRSGLRRLRHELEDASGRAQLSQGRFSDQENAARPVGLTPNEPRLLNAG